MNKALSASVKNEISQNSYSYFPLISFTATAAFALILFTWFLPFECSSGFSSLTLADLGLITPEKRVAPR